MRVTTAKTGTSLAAIALALAGLTLTACSGGDDKAADSSSSASASASASASGGSSTGASSVGEKGASADGSASSGKSVGAAAGRGADGATQACTTKNTKVTFTASPFHASEQQAATATVKVTNTSGVTCTIVGASTLTAKDDQDKAQPIETDNHENGTDAVDLKPGASAQARVAYKDLNFDGSESAREVCAVQASTVEIALPKDVARSVQVTKTNGSAGIFNVCDPEVSFSGFEI